ncbi:hypothetical protein ml_12 [Mollivirus sibericum]|nr:hypothetical protein ml_12 [Mollivirus sibericum]ALD61814.1 hypothetical protein ml_12 [Mollivirus sibericum]
MGGRDGAEKARPRPRSCRHPQPHRSVGQQPPLPTKPRNGWPYTNRSPKPNQPTIRTMDHHHQTLAWTDVAIGEADKANAKKSPSLSPIDQPTCPHHWATTTKSCEGRTDGGRSPRRPSQDVAASSLSPTNCLCHGPPPHPGQMEQMEQTDKAKRPRSCRRLQPPNQPTVRTVGPSPNLGMEGTDRWMGQRRRPSQPKKMSSPTDRTVGPWTSAKSRKGGTDGWGKEGQGQAKLLSLSLTVQLNHHH